MYFLFSKALQAKKYLLTVLCLSAIILPGSVHAQTEFRAERIKAALIYYVAKFVEWPETKSEPPKPLLICSTVNDDVSRFLPDTFRGKSARGRPLQIMEMTLAEAKNAPCDIVYVGQLKLSASERELLNHIEKQGDKLTICLSNRLETENCLVQIFEDENRAKIAVNHNLRQAFRLKLSSELLDVALDPHTTIRSPAEPAR